MYIYLSLSIYIWVNNTKNRLLERYPTPLVSVFPLSVSYGNNEAQQTSEEYMTTTITAFLFHTPHHNNF